MRVVHAADLHIDSPLRGLGRIEGAPVDDIRLATRKAFRRLVDLCLDESAQLLLLAGDVFDGEWRDFNTGLFFVRELSRLREVGTRVVMVRGNHDAESVLSRSIPLPDHVSTLAADAPETLIFDDLGVAVHGQSYVTRSVEENLAEAYPAKIDGLCNIGLLHTNAVGAAEHGNYAPCTVGQLVGHGYDYWALGHVHRREVLSSEPWVVYPGNLQGRHARETGPKGCAVLTIDDARIRAVDHRDVDVVRWAQVSASADAARSADDLLDQVRRGLQSAAAGADGRPLLARVVVDGATPLHDALAARPEPFQAQIRAIAADLGAVWPEKIRFATTQPLADDGRGDRLGQLFAALRTEVQHLAADPIALAPYLDDLSALVQGAAQYLDARPDDPARAARRLQAIEALLLGKLGAPAEPLRR
ncbi:MAG TPA: DNA repair exonuclease [Nannocystaceae bacterium]|nr:DNA repair exonuclease [Nannocystaceae bacterium]